MPWHRDPEECRCVQVTITARVRDIKDWRREAEAMGISLSRAIWLRAQAGRPLPSEGHLALAKALGPIGNNLNQAVRALHHEGCVSSALAVEETLRAVACLQEELRRL